MTHSLWAPDLPALGKPALRSEVIRVSEIGAGLAMSKTPNLPRLLRRTLKTPCIFKVVFNGIIRHWCVFTTPVFFTGVQIPVCKKQICKLPPGGR